MYMNLEQIDKILDEVSEGTDFAFRFGDVTENEIKLYMQGDNPCGEDWCETLTIHKPETEDELIEYLAGQVQEIYECFDIEENTYLMLEAKRNGFRGVPEVVDLVHNEEYKENALKEFYEKLWKLI